MASSENIGGRPPAIPRMRYKLETRNKQHSKRNQNSQSETSCLEFCDFDHSDFELRVFSAEAPTALSASHENNLRALCCPIPELASPRDNSPYGRHRFPSC